MSILIDETKLNLLLEQKKQFIGRKVAWDSILSAVSFLISVLFASYDKVMLIPGVVLKTVFVLLGIGFTAKSLYDLALGLKNNYGFEDLLADINKLNEIAHNHSIVIIKDSFLPFSNRYLVYDDRRWNCLLFPNYKDNPNNEEFIRSHISSELKVDVSKIRLSYVASRIHEKYSESAKCNKMYSHKFYLAQIDGFPDTMKQDSFECDGKLYFWKNITELELDDNVRKKNSDIVGFVKELF